MPGFPWLAWGGTEGYIVSEGERQAVAAEEGLEQREVYYRGSVQGVGFRYTARQLAARFAVAGYVKNLPDGRVLVVAEGRAEELDRFLRAIGDVLGHYIHDSADTVRRATGGFRNFEIRF